MGSSRYFYLGSRRNRQLGTTLSLPGGMGTTRRREAKKPIWRNAFAFQGLLTLVVAACDRTDELLKEYSPERGPTKPASRSSHCAFRMCQSPHAPIRARRLPIQG